MPPITVAAARLAIKPKMPDAYCAWLDCELLLAQATGWHQNRLLTEPDLTLDDDTRERLDEMVRRRSTGEPMAYITNTAGFMDLVLRVTPAVLIPRPETETLVDTLLRLTHPPQTKMLDLGTGSGAIALAVAKYKPDWHIVATDCSAEALSVASHNGRALGFNVQFVHGNWLNFCAQSCFDVIASNPPYIPADDQCLHKDGLQFEPVGALAGGPDGLAHIRQIVSDASRCLKPNGWLLLEHGFDQSSKTTRLLSDAGFVKVSTHTDIRGQDRISLGQLQK